jgi:hypothetical protein
MTIATVLPVASAASRATRARPSPAMMASTICHCTERDGSVIGPESRGTPALQEAGAAI